MQFLKDLAFPTVALIIGSIMLLLAIAKKIKTKFIEFPELKTQQQRLQLGITGVLLIFASLALQFFTSTTIPESINADSLTAAQSTISSLQTQLALPTVAVNTPSLQATVPLVGDTVTPVFTITSTSPSTLTPTPNSTPTSLPVAEFCLNFSSAIVRTDPGFNYPQKAILKNPYAISDPVCPRFDFRMPDSSWVRIAPNQENSDYIPYELGWIPANQLRPNDIDVLRIYFPESVQSGKYCATSRYGVNVRIYPNTNSEITGTLYPRDCLFVDARSADNQWVRISSKQEESKYSRYIGNWINTSYIAPFDFSGEWNSSLQYYLTALPTAIPLPTPGG